MPFDPPADLVAALREAQRIVVMTGAGVSAESGVPTYRDALTGQWASHDPARLATPEAFEHDPALVARWYDERRVALGRCAPNPGHHALAAMERAVERAGGAFTLITQNVDRLHHAAGSSAPIELHGALWVWRCASCGEEREERGEPFADHPPRCACGGTRRPGVVWFGEALPEEALVASFEALSACELMLVVGTSGLVYPAAGLAGVAREAGARLAEVNPDATPQSGGFDWTLRARSGEALPALARAAFDDVA